MKVEEILTFLLQIAGDLLDLVGDGAFETVQDLIMVRPKFCIALLSEVCGSTLCA